MAVPSYERSGDGEPARHPGRQAVTIRARVRVSGNALCVALGAADYQTRVEPDVGQVLTNMASNFVVCSK